MSNYPDGMSASDYAYLSGENEPASWFEDLVNEEGEPEMIDFWEEFCDECGPDGYYSWTRSDAIEFMQDRHPEAYSGAI